MKFMAKIGPHRTLRWSPLPIRASDYLEGHGYSRPLPMRASDLKEAPDIAVKNECVPSRYASNWRSSALRRIEGSSLVAHLCED